MANILFYGASDWLFIFQFLTKHTNGSFFGWDNILSIGLLMGWFIFHPYFDVLIGKMTKKVEFKLTLEPPKRVLCT
jgi:hypothetical protein